ncbi:MAG: biopolymer transporter ExbD [Tenuifilum sp.]|uniref:ExbD/TolR family protein n=1 Tax=Tenuifilum TaxID=2760873 RepID=UPI0019A6599A|nr:biopolymer transporter ExbD [Bacteroidales bacterium]HOK61620.1 biopolymer transporter ExbD [Tenuifilum sp.]MBP7170879.1 biopolymer transporter ExbD [Bacteroidales bacterium]MBP9029749.1 biopolymer transporter ExbD [Bacteroidales bacterium]HOK86343.1 biopolymer transporter ExbD [Tenuifilum sp.]
MALKRRVKVEPSFSMSSMTDIVFLLLIFFMVSSTLIHPNALKLLLPQSNSQVSAKPITSVSITADRNFYLETVPVTLGQLEYLLQQKMKGQDDPTIALHVDRSVPMEEVVKVMNIAKDNKYKLILATQPLQKR